MKIEKNGNLSSTYVDNMNIQRFTVPMREIIGICMTGHIGHKGLFLYWP